MISFWTQVGSPRSVQKQTAKMRQLTGGVWFMTTRIIIRIESIRLEPVAMHRWVNAKIISTFRAGRASWMEVVAGKSNARASSQSAL